MAHACGINFSRTSCRAFRSHQERSSDVGLLRGRNRFALNSCTRGATEKILERCASVRRGDAIAMIPYDELCQEVIPFPSSHHRDMEGNYPHQNACCVTLFAAPSVDHVSGHVMTATREANPSCQIENIARFFISSLNEGVTIVSPTPSRAACYPRPSERPGAVRTASARQKAAEKVGGRDADIATNQPVRVRAPFDHC